MSDETNYAKAERLGVKLMQQHWMLGLAESCTGGGLAATLTTVVGSSHWFDAAIVSYSNAAKQTLLDVPQQLITQFGAVSEQTAKAMADGLLQKRQIDLALSITGTAGPGGGSIAKPVGTVWFGLAHRNQSAKAYYQFFSGGREHIRQCAIRYALNLLLSC